MKVFQDKGKTILPRVDSILLLSRLLVVLGIFALFSVETLTLGQVAVISGLTVVFLLLLGLFWFYIRQGRYNLKYPFLAIILFELILIPILVHLTGGFNSHFYLYYYLTVTFAAYMLTLPVTLVILGVISLLYPVLVWQDMATHQIINLIVRLGFMWFLSLAIAYVADYIRRSEQRLLNLFNTLNMRTSELEKSQAHLELTYENTRVLAGILDMEGVVQEVMRIMGRILGFPASGILLMGPGKNLVYRGRAIAGQSNFHLKAADAENNELIYRVTRQKEPVAIVDTEGRKDYQPLRISSRSVLLVPMVAHGKTIGVLTAESSQVGAFGEKEQKIVLVVARAAGMALENAMLHKKMEELTITDELTGIYNYRYFAMKMKEEQRRAVRYDLPLSLIMLDIDWFKRFNDTYGHEVGNLVLKGITSVVKRCIRDVDIFCRYGGEEFVVILPQTPRTEAEQIGERIRHQIERAVFGGGEGIPDLKVTVSVGITSYPENGRPDDDLLSVADTALYRAKGSGKNKVCVI